MNKPFFLRHQFLFLVGLFMLAAGLPVSKFLTGFSQVVLLVSFFAEGNFAAKLQRLKQNKTVWIICGIWLMHIAGLLYSDNVSAGFWDARMKTPIILFTLVMGSAEALSPVMVRRIMWTFIFSVLLGSLVSTAVLAGIINRPVVDIRDIFIFHISHIRFALFICLGVFFMGWQMFSYRENISMALRIVYALLIIWFVVFLFLAELVTGLAILCTLAIPALIVLGLTRRSRQSKIIVLTLAVILPSIVAIQAFSFLKEINKPHDIAINTNEKTALGNAYSFYPEDRLSENGYRVWIYVNREELRDAWNKRSAMPFDSSDKKAQPLSQTLIRFLTSLGWRKDAEAVNRLSTAQIQTIESGVANCNYMGISNFKARLMELNWEFQQAVNNQSASGHSATMRIEFWKAGWQILQQNFWTGVGTGDLQQAYDRQYEVMKSRLASQWRLRAHNQYLSIALAFGIFGFLYFLFALLYPVISGGKYKDFVYVFFMAIFLLSMLTEDTLETPAGSAFYAFFNSLFLFSGLQGREKTEEAPGSAKA